MARGRFRLELNRKGVGELLRRYDVGDLCEEHGQGMAQYAAGDDPTGGTYKVARFQGADRVRVHVATADPAAMRAEALDRVLTRAAYRYIARHGGGGDE